MSDQAVLLSKWSPYERIILAKEQLCHLYTFGTMTILIFSPFANFGNQSLWVGSASVLQWGIEFYSLQTKSNLQLWVANFKFLQLSAGCSNLYISISTTKTPLYIFCQITGTKCSGLIFEPPFSPWRAQLDPQKVVTGQQSSLSKLSFKKYWLLSFHDMISTLHPAKIIFYHAIFDLNSNFDSKFGYFVKQKVVTGQQSSLSI